MNEYIKKFCESVTLNDIIDKNDNILIALSGGPDSVFLLHMLCAVKDDYSLKLGAFHLNHNLRKTALRDENFCRELCEKNNIVFYPYSEDIAALADKNKISTEEAGRLKRYNIMSELSSIYNKVATAHHADDNAETVLMRIIRGTGVSGLCGIPKMRDGYIIRPLLDFTKAEIISYLDANSLEYVLDETNSANDYFRNRVRNVILPELKKENPNITLSLNNLSKTAAMYSELADKSADDISFKLNSDKSISLAFDDIKDKPDAVLFHFIKKTAIILNEGNDISFESLQAVKQLIKDTDNTVWECDTAHLIVKRRYATVTVQAYGVHASTLEEYLFELKVPSFNVFAKEKFSVKLYLRQGDISYLKNIKNNSERYITAVDYDKITNNIIIRNRRSGDFYRQIGMSGVKSVKRLFIDRKIVRENRAAIPIVVDGEKIVCILGMETDANYSVTKSTKHILLIEYKTWGN